MLKALFKKELLETISLFFLDKKKGKKRNPLAVVVLFALIAYALIGSCVMIWWLCDMLCAPLVESGLGWVYFAFVSIFATGLACLGSVFAAKSKLFEAKDNETLLAMPLPTWAILLSRMVFLYLLTFLCYALVFTPALVQYLIVVGFSFSALVCGVALIVFVPFALLAVCALVGWAIAWLSARLPLKNLLTVVTFFAFMVFYFLFMAKVNEYLGFVIANGEQVGESIRNKLYPFWKLGLAACGDWLSLLIIIGLSAVLFALVFWILQRTFISVVTHKRGTRKKKYKGENVKCAPVGAWLVKKELLRFFKNPMLFLNAGVGTILSLVLAVVALFNGALFETLKSLMSIDEAGSLVAVILCFIATSNIFTGASISLEGENLWILRSFPISVGAIFRGKILAHCLLTACPVTLACVSVCAMLKLPFFTSLLIFLLLLAVVILCASLGLVVNLKLPNLQWTNEVVAVKQSVSALIAMFAGWGVSLLVLGGWFLLKKVMGLQLFLALFLLLFAGVSLGLCAWLKGKGKVAFERL